MIAQSAPRNQQINWVDELRAAYVRPLDLLRDLGLSNADTSTLDLHADFPFRVPRPFVRRMRRGDRQDPLLLQVLPLAAERDEVAGYRADPVGDIAMRRSPALLHKYHGRALLITTGGCAINCRYCFRRHYPYAASVGRANIAAAIEEVRTDASISEIILSGGDPLMLKDDRVAEIVAACAAIPHLRRLRVHTRLPVTIPARITDALLTALTCTRLTTVMVVHINHANEIDTELRTALRACSQAGLQLLNQSVLLRGINDEATVLADLSESLFDASVLPYYIHLLDPVVGAAHFNVDESLARSLAASLRARLPGYLVPRFVRETAGENAKTPIA